MRKLFLFIAAALVSTSMWATDVTLGFTTATCSKNATSGGERTLTNVANTTVAHELVSTTSGALSLYATADKEYEMSSTNNKGYSRGGYKWNVNTGTSLGTSNNTVGFSVTIGEGKTFSFSSINFAIGATANMVYQVIVYQGTDTLYNGTEYTFTRGSRTANTNQTLNVTGLSTQENLQKLTGTFYVRARFAFNSTGKYFFLPTFTITGDLANTQAYTVTYNINNGSATADVVESASLVGANPFTYTGYRFMGWNTQANGKGTTYEEGDLVTSALTLYAQWAQLFSVTYNANEASGTVPTEAQHIQGETFDVANQGSLESPDGKAFGGWTYNANTYAPGYEFEMPANDVEFVANWIDTYTVTYKANGGTGDDIVVDDSPATVASCSFTAPASKEFLKWNTKADGTGKSYAPGDAIISGETLYAQWIISKKTLFEWTAANSNNVTEDNTDLSKSGYGSLTTGTAVAGRILAVDSTCLEKNSAGYKIQHDTTCIEIQGIYDFEAGDTIILLGQGGGSKDDRGFVIGPETMTFSTGTAGIQTNLIYGSPANSTYKAVITETQAGEKLRIFRLTGKNIYCKTIKVIRPIKYNVIFAAGEGSGSMSVLSYAQGAEVSLPECSFTAPDDKVFDAWTSTDVTIFAGKFTMPADNVVITATWKEDGGETALDNTADEAKAVKFFKDGQIFIEKNGHVYNVLGGRVK